MGISIATDDQEDEVVSAINTTPLVDVMLVLLIIFLITIPVVTQTIPVDLPKESNQPRQTKPENINLSVDRQGRVFWNEEPVANPEQLVERLTGAVGSDAQVEVQIRGDLAGRYEHVGRVVLACQRAGISKIGFVTEPPPRG